ncbi:MULTISPECIES: hypothetical protein [Hydrogenophaga]|uniref:Uncharacterized protein n=1 Tax=Hydrogenophaga intermedia TaxID=65786 RepID=A0A1L1PM01_HYDIT|nr:MULTISPECIES: hypothetical protein [Hydrogenophaga]AOS81517.1 hypothetical protein Q5W_22465 [Hydrogenophaga sp. PBC]TMU73355.1 hypothetical protein FGJ01_16040 [Hydrogenophaga intermedia]CDN88739.1 hypothetical protein BN948_03175 [Hydrogenophaga intermedia]
MNSSLVHQVSLLWEGSDGTRASVISQRSPLDAIQSWKDVDRLMPPKRQLETALLLDDNTYVPLPFCDLAWILPDRTGVLVIFKPGSYTRSDGSDVFACPNNAAIFNADASLRCQVRFSDAPERSASYVVGLPFTRTKTHKELPIGRRGEPIDPPIVQFGVLIGTKEHPPESFFVLDTETGELTDDLFRVPY